jgi:hypothetical protein
MPSLPPVLHRRVVVQLVLVHIGAIFVEDSRVGFSRGYGNEKECTVSQIPGSMSVYILVEIILKNVLRNCGNRT